MLVHYTYGCHPPGTGLEVESVVQLVLERGPRTSVRTAASGSSPELCPPLSKENGGSFSLLTGREDPILDSFQPKRQGGGKCSGMGWRVKRPNC